MYNVSILGIYIDYTFYLLVTKYKHFIFFQVIRRSTFPRQPTIVCNYFMVRQNINVHFSNTKDDSSFPRNKNSLIPYIFQDKAHVITLHLYSHGQSRIVCNYFMAGQNIYFHFSNTKIDSGFPRNRKSFISYISR